MSALLPGPGTLAVEIVSVFQNGQARVKYGSAVFIADNVDLANVFHPEDGETP